MWDMWDIEDSILSAQTRIEKLRLGEPVRFRRLSSGAQLPVFGTPESACFDIQACLMPGTPVKMYSAKNVPATRDITGNNLLISPNERVLVPTGWAVACPHRHSLRIYSRSGLTLKQGLIVVNGVGMVDADYRHEVFVLLSNISNCATTITHGDRIAQGEFVKPQHRFDLTLLDVDDTDWFTTSRQGGFGSTGVQ